MKLNSQQVGRAGEFFVAAEIHRRGGYAATFAGNMPGIDILASSLDQTSKVSIQVKTRRSGTWQVRVGDGEPRTEKPKEDKFWVFVDIGGDQPEYYITPEWWIRNDIYENHRTGAEAEHPDRCYASSDRHIIHLKRITHWHDHWELLGILPIP